MLVEFAGQLLITATVVHYFSHKKQTIMETYMIKPKVYLAGPQIFRIDASEHGEYLKRLCSEHGVEGLYPLDNEVAPGPNAAREVYEGDVAMVKECDLVLANISRFRGPSCDVGTAIEIGMAHALGKPVIAYGEDGLTYNEAVYHYGMNDDMNVEDLGLSDNLMVICSCEQVFKTLEDALKYIKGQFSSH